MDLTTFQAYNSKLQVSQSKFLMAKLHSLHKHLQCHITCSYEGDLILVSCILMVESQIINLTPNHSFLHNLSFKSPNGAWKPILYIWISKLFQGFQKAYFNIICYLHFCLEIKNFNSQNGKTIWEFWDSLELTVVKCAWI